MVAASVQVKADSGITDADLVFMSRVDAWLALCVGAAIALCLYAAWSQQSLFALAIGGFTVATVVALTVPCKYTMKTNRLEIRCGLLRQVVPFADITGIEPSRSIVSAPALSLKRVKISCARTVYLVSPKERERFIEELRGRVAAAVAHPDVPNGAREKE